MIPSPSHPWRRSFSPNGVRNWAFKKARKGRKMPGFFDDLESLIGAAEVATGVSGSVSRGTSEASTGDLQEWANIKCEEIIKPFSAILPASHQDLLRSSIMKALQDSFAEGVKRGSGLNVSR